MKIVTTTTYDVVSALAIRTAPCPGCGKKTRRSRTFTNTVSPWNTTGEGAQRRPKAYAEVQAAVNDQAAAWAPDPETFRHDKCRPAPGEPDDG